MLTQSPAKHQIVNDKSVRGKSTPWLSDRFLFVLVCAFWISQVFLIPFAAIGPWPVWPAVADVVIPLMIPAMFFPSGGNHAARRPTILSVAIGAFCFISFAAATLIYGFGSPGVLFGMHQLYRITQFVIAVIATSRIRLTPERMKTLAWLSVGVFFITSLGVFATAFDFLSTSMVTPYLGDSPLAAGPWESYMDGTIHEGIGFISYNHGYTAIQLLLCAGLSLSLNNFGSRMRTLIYLVLIAATFVSQSRVGFICAVIFAALCELRNSRLILLAVLAISALVALYVSSADAFSTFADRLVSSASPSDDVGISARTDIWKEHIQYFEKNPLAVLTGAGFGYALKASTDNAHLLYLHILTELGLGGLALFIFGNWKLLASLAARKSFAMYWMVWCLLLTGLTQETFYPTIVFTHFVAFFGSAIVAVLRAKSQPALAGVPSMRSSAAST